MEKHKPHETSSNSRKIIKYIMIGISALTFVSATSIPWSVLTFKEITLSLIGLLFINGFLFWSYHILYVWKQRILEYLELKYNVKIVVNTAGSFNIVGDAGIMTRLSINMQILFYFLLGMTGPLALFIGVLLLFR
jgi:hypothetical protein